MSAPDRIWYRISEERSYSAPVEGSVEYLLATPQLLALIEAKEAWHKAEVVRLQDIHSPVKIHAVVDARDAYDAAAFAFAKSQDHPDAG